MQLLLPQIKGPRPSVIALQATPSVIEVLLLRSMEWMTFEGGTSYHTALEQTTVFLRCFPVNSHPSTNLRNESQNTFTTGSSSRSGSL
ncbi:hypothetical protein BDR03DRAFT_958011 [Suillus americanus]|nr:hypothetical protein BDR03DRAFT_958011 [Suillus americanus]